MQGACTRYHGLIGSASGLRPDLSEQETRDWIQSQYSVVKLSISEAIAMFAYTQPAYTQRAYSRTWRLQMLGSQSLTLFMKIPLRVDIGDGS